jgi:hypothetical protein
MTVTTRHRNANANRRDAPTHLFALGQAVRLRGSFPKSDETYRITATLPPRGDSLQYRIRNDDERHERVTTQDNLEPIDLSQASAGETLLERTFGHVQGTEVQQPRDGNPEDGDGAARA